MTKEIYQLFSDNKQLPKGTRIQTTMGGVKTGGTHELSDNLLESANKVPNHLSEYVPFWILGWRDLLNDLSVPESSLPSKDTKKEGERE